jgi:hypothetical protein
LLHGFPGRLFFIVHESFVISLLFPCCQLLVVPERSRWIVNWLRWHNFSISIVND